MTDPIVLDYAAPPPGVPTAFKIVAWLFIATGICAGIQIVVSTWNGKVFFDLDVFGILVGRGLLHWNRGWRTCALVFLWVGMIFTPIAIFATLATRTSEVELFGIPSFSAPPALGLGFTTAIFALLIWEYRVLVREDIRRRFGLPPR